MDLGFIKEKAVEVSKEMKDRKDMIDKQDGQVSKVKGKGLLFNCVKYGTAITPIVLPFALIFYFTNDLLMALLSTFIIDIVLFAGLVYYTLQKTLGETLE
jgi:hypothetical protein